jgi:phosphohistidine phosphatase
MKTVILLRHAEAGRHPDDYERALTVAGRNAARRTAERLAVEAPPIDWAITSAALRAQTTAELVLAQLGAKITLASQESLYEAGIDTYLNALRAAPDAASCVLLVGHNPTLSAIAQRLTGRNVSLEPAEWVLVQSDTDWARFGRA